MGYIIKPCKQHQFNSKAVIGVLYIIVLLLAILFFAYRRYYPVKEVQCMRKFEVKQLGQTVVDVRHYHEVQDGMDVAIPYAYLKRFYVEIPNSQIHVIAADKVGMHLDVRFLRKKGFQVNIQRRDREYEN
jgi:hypothetical protein